MAFLPPTPPSNLPYTTLQRRSTILPHNPASIVFLSLFTLFLIFTLFTTIAALFIRRLSPRTYFLTSINPLILCFTWPYHLHIYLQQRRNMKAVKRLADAESAESGFTAQRMMSVQSRIAAPHAHPPLSKPLDLGLRNQIPLQVLSIREGGRDFITVTEGPVPSPPTVQTHMLSAHFRRTSPTSSRPASLRGPSGGRYASPYAVDDVDADSRRSYFAGPNRLLSVKNDRGSGYVYNSADGWRDTLELETGRGMEDVGLSPPLSAKAIV